MVQFFVGPPSQQALDSQLIGQNLGQGLGQVAQRGMLQNYLQQAQQAAQGAQTPLQQAFALMQAGAAIPGSERYLATLLPLLMQQSQNKAKAQMDLTNQQDMRQAARQSQMPEQVTQRQQMPGFMAQQGEQQNPYYPSVLGGKESPGNMPQRSTADQLTPVPTDDEIRATAVRESVKTGNIVPVEEIEKRLFQKRENIIQQNEITKKEIEAKKQAQRDYGEFAGKELQKFIPDASPQMLAMSQKWGEEAAENNKSEALIKREIASKVTNFRNKLSALQKSAPAMRSYNKVIRNIKGNEASFDQARNDIRAKVKFLTDEGLYDLARKEISGFGFAPEETESILFDLPEKANQLFAQMPNIKNIRDAGVSYEKGYPTYENQLMPQNKIDALKNNLKDILKSDNNVNLLLLRREYEQKKNVDWRSFKDVLNDLILSGDVNLNDDQLNMLDKLEDPPLGPLDKILYNLGFIGR